MNGAAAPAEPELAARIERLDGHEARHALYWLATGSDAVRADLAKALDATDRRRADLDRIRREHETDGAR